MNFARQVGNTKKSPINANTSEIEQRKIPKNLDEIILGKVKIQFFGKDNKEFKIKGKLGDYQGKWVGEALYGILQKVGVKKEDFNGKIVRGLEINGKKANLWEDKISDYFIPTTKEIEGIKVEYNGIDITLTLYPDFHCPLNYKI